MAYPLELAKGLIRPAVRRARHRWRRHLVRGRTKVFCVGRNKTGTTSLGAAFRQHGMEVGSQLHAERIAHTDYFDGRWDRLIRYCESAEVFQDIPFSWPNTFRVVDRAFPGAKFILTVRDDEHQWYSSLTRFHAKKFGRAGQLPTADDLRSADYVVPGFAYNLVRIHGTPDACPYDERTLKANYLRHNREVREYFLGRENNFLEVNVARPADYQRLCEFVGWDGSSGEGFPWENRT